MKSIHLICAKCGSDEVVFKITKPTEEDCGVYTKCLNCGELDSVEHHNERQEERNVKEN